MMTRRGLFQSLIQECGPQQAVTARRILHAVTDLAWEESDILKWGKYSMKSRRRKRNAMFRARKLLYDVLCMKCRACGNKWHP